MRIQERTPVEEVKEYSENSDGSEPTSPNSPCWQPDSELLKPQSSVDLQAGMCASRYGWVIRPNPKYMD